MMEEHYLNIKLSDEITPPTIGAFLPQSDKVRANEPLTVIVYFHGNIISDCLTDEDLFLKRGIEYYWRTQLFTCLRQDLAASGKNVLLLAPTLSVRFGSLNAGWASRYGDLDEDLRFDVMIQTAFKQLRALGALPDGVRPGKIILAAHSAGGVPMQRILDAKNALADNIVECWGFECLYWGIAAYVDWLDEHPDKRFYHFRRLSEFPAWTRALKDNKTNFYDYPNGKEHCTLLRDCWARAIIESRALQEPADRLVVAAKKRGVWDRVASIWRRGQYS